MLFMGGRRNTADLANMRRHYDYNRAKILSEAKERHAEAARRSGLYAIGRDDHGLVKETKQLSALRIKVSSWYVKTGFKRDDWQRLKNMGWREVEAQLKKGGVEKKESYSESHVITAVRQLKHVREGYENELAKTDPIPLYRLNKTISDKGAQASDEDIDKLLFHLNDIACILRKERSAVKRKVGLGRLEWTIKKFQDAKSVPIGKRGMQVGSACAVFTSMRERITSWREKEIAGKKEFNHQRECSLRVERDSWLLSQFRKFESSTETVYGYALKDAAKKEVLEQMKEIIKDLQRTDGNIRQIQGRRPKKPEKLEKKEQDLQEQNELFESQRKELGKLMWANWEKFSKTQIKKKPTYLAGDYGSISRYVKNGKLDKAMAKTDYMILFSDSNKPRFIFDELSKDPDPYLEKALADFEKALTAFEGQDFKKAKEYFLSAASRMRTIVYPSR